MCSEFRKATDVEHMKVNCFVLQRCRGFGRWKVLQNRVHGCIIHGRQHTFVRVASSIAHPPFFAQPPPKLLLGLRLAGLERHYTAHAHAPSWLLVYRPKEAAGSRGRRRTIATSPSRCSGGAVGSTWRAPRALAVQMGGPSVITLRWPWPHSPSPPAGRNLILLPLPEESGRVRRMSSGRPLIPWRNHAFLH
jgi:hypothetical protein